MVCPVEVACHFGFLRVMYDLVEVGFKPFFQTVLRLSHILFTTAFACNTEYQVVTISVDVVSAVILSTYYVGAHFTSFIQHRAVSAMLAFASFFQISGFRPCILGHFRSVGVPLPTCP